jgi:hypothetical protein
MPEDDPLWECTIALLRASLSPRLLPSSARGTGSPPADPPCPGKRPHGLPEIDALPLPFGSAACAVRERFAQQLRSGSSSAIIESLIAANLLLSPAERLVASWIPCLVALAGLRRDARPAPSAALLLHFISENARVQLSKLPPGIATTWLVGRDRYERCAARLLALLFMRRGRTFSTWAAEEPPKFACYLLAGIGAADAVGDLPANCQGTSDLIAEAQQNHALAQAASLWGTAGTVTAATSAARRSITA